MGKNQRGINVVVYDYVEGIVLDPASFDTYDSSKRVGNAEKELQNPPKKTVCLQRWILLRHGLKDTARKAMAQRINNCIAEY